MKKKVVVLAVVVLVGAAGCQQVSRQAHVVKSLSADFKALNISSIAILRPTTAPQSGGGATLFRQGLYQALLEKKYAPISLSFLDNRTTEDLSPQEVSDRLNGADAVLKTHLLSWRTKLHQGDEYQVVALSIELLSGQTGDSLWSAHIENLWVPTAVSLLQTNEEAARAVLASLPDRPVHPYDVK